MIERRRLTFAVGGEECVAYLHLPPGVAAARPTVVMAHGFSGTQGGALARTALDFAEAGFAVLTFDYRGFGESGGLPRQVVDVGDQLADWRAAVRLARSLEAVDPGRIALWGSSLSGAHVVHVAARDRNVAAVIAQVPFNGFAGGGGPAPRDVLALLVEALRDRLGAWFGRAPRYVPVVGLPETRAVISTERAEAVKRSLEGSRWRNRVAARSLLALLGYRASPAARRLCAPLLVCIAERDDQTPPHLARKVAEATVRGRILVYPCTHFDMYEEPYRARAARDQVDFLARVMRRTRSGGGATAEINTARG